MVLKVDEIGGAFVVLAFVEELSIGCERQWEEEEDDNERYHLVGLLICLVGSGNVGDLIIGSGVVFTIYLLLVFFLVKVISNGNLSILSFNQLEIVNVIQFASN